MLDLKRQKSSTMQMAPQFASPLALSGLGGAFNWPTGRTDHSLAVPAAGVTGLGVADKRRPMILLINRQQRKLFLPQVKNNHAVGTRVDALHTNSRLRRKVFISVLYLFENRFGCFGKPPAVENDVNPPVDSFPHSARQSLICIYVYRLITDSGLVVNAFRNQNHSSTCNSCTRHRLTARFERDISRHSTITN